MQGPQQPNDRVQSGVNLSNSCYRCVLGRAWVSDFGSSFPWLLLLQLCLWCRAVASALKSVVHAPQRVVECVESVSCTCSLMFFLLQIALAFAIAQSPCLSQFCRSLLACQQPATNTTTNSQPFKPLFLKFNSKTASQFEDRLSNLRAVL